MREELLPYKVQGAAMVIAQHQKAVLVGMLHFQADAQVVQILTWSQFVILWEPLLRIIAKRVLPHRKVAVLGLWPDGVVLLEVENK